MPDRVRYQGMTHWGYRVALTIEWKGSGDTTREPFVRFLCAEHLQPVKSAVFVRDNVDCMSCLVTQAREERR
jgi:hypothetical protein